MELFCLPRTWSPGGVPCREWKLVLPNYLEASTTLLGAIFWIERSFQWKQEGVKALSEYAAKEQATRILTVKLRAERFAREAASAKRDPKKAAKA